ncbi:AAA family ATPase [Pelotomaculum propionicicum]|uniref:AAA family ATPase n=1 Tax=Pelotomaculum propionicicum TaxID=258475 RepID=UPI003B78B792
MIYVVGPEWLTAKLSDLELTDKPENARCAVIKMPGNAKEIESLPAGLPVLIVVSGMMSFGDAKAVRGLKQVSDKEVSEEVKKILKTTEKVSEDFIDDDDDIIIDSEPEKPVAPLEQRKPERSARKPEVVREPEQPIKEPQAAREPVRRLPVREPVRAEVRKPEIAQGVKQLPNAEVKKAEIPQVVTRFPMKKEPRVEAVQRESIKEEPAERPTQKKSYRKEILTPRTMKGLIIPSYSAVGGEGKTFMATNLGALCAMTGVSTCLVDLDLGFGDIEVAAGLVDEVDRLKVMDKKAFVPPNGWATVTDWRKFAVNLKANILRHNSGLYTMPSYPYAGGPLPEPEIEDLLERLVENFELVVVDLGVDGFSSQAKVALRMANAIMIVAGQDTKTIAKMSHFLNQEGGINSKMQLVFNKRTSTAYYEPREVAKKMGFDKYYSVPLDEAGVIAAKRLRKLVVQVPGTPAGEAIRSYAAAITPFNIPAGEVVVNRKAPSIFSKLFAKLKRA